MDAMVPPGVADAAGQLPGQAPGLSWQNLLNWPGEVPPVEPPVVVPV
jgi:hypothetical protein